MAYTSSCINPLLYAFLSENFRKAFYKVGKGFSAGGSFARVSTVSIVAKPSNCVVHQLLPSECMVNISVHSGCCQLKYFKRIVRRYFLFPFFFLFGFRHIFVAFLRAHTASTLDPVYRILLIYKVAEMRYNMGFCSVEHDFPRCCELARYSTMCVPPGPCPCLRF